MPKKKERPFILSQQSPALADPIVTLRTPTGPILRWRIAGVDVDEQT
jgi:hypothetical protein